MPTLDPRIDAYIAAAAAFAQPILKHLRALVHAECPEVVETWKWSFPHFEYHGLLCSMAAFKAHVAFGFWKHDLVVPEAMRSDAAMGQYGKVTAIADLPDAETLRAQIRKAMALNETGVKSPGRERPAQPRPAPETPADLAAALAANASAQAHFARFAPSQQREYTEWLEEAKRPETRSKRLAQAVEWIAEGKQRHWKYQNC